MFRFSTARSAAGSAIPARSTTCSRSSTPRARISSARPASRKTSATSPRPTRSCCCSTRCRCAGPGSWPSRAPGCPRRDASRTTRSTCWNGSLTWSMTIDGGPKKKDSQAARYRVLQARRADSARPQGDQPAAAAGPGHAVLRRNRQPGGAHGNPAPADPVGRGPDRRDLREVLPALPLLRVVRAG